MHFFGGLGAFYGTCSLGGGKQGMLKSEPPPQKKSQQNIAFMLTIQCKKENDPQQYLPTLSSLFGKPQLLDFIITSKSVGLCFQCAQVSRDQIGIQIQAGRSASRIKQATKKQASSLIQDITGKQASSLIQDITGKQARSLIQDITGVQGYKDSVCLLIQLVFRGFLQNLSI